MLCGLRRLAWSMPFYDRQGRRLLFRDEWEHVGRWRRFRYLLLGWDPPKSWRVPEDLRAEIPSSAPCASAPAPLGARRPGRSV
jgi:hypothetical protein